MKFQLSIPRRILGAGAVYGIVALVCTQISLLNYLGYEFSFVIALFAAPISGFITIGNVRDVSGRPMPEDTRRDIPATLRESITTNLVLLIIPFVVMLTNGLFIRNCSLVEGTGFFVLLPGVTALFGSALGFFCAMHYRHARMVYVLLMIVSFCYALYLGYVTPAVFAYNVFFGYFPGLTYDEALSISTTLVFFRILTIGLAALFIWMGMILLRHTDPGNPVWTKGNTLVRQLWETDRRGITVGISVVLVLVVVYRCELGFETSHRYIRTQLGSRYETSHFTLYYAQRSYSDDEIRWIGAEHEFRLRQVLDAFSLSYDGRLESYIYPSAAEKRRLMGAGNTNIAKPWSDELHITAQSLGSTLKHELVHVVAAPFGLPIINTSSSTGLVEGLAMAIDWDWGNRTLHQYAAAMEKFGVAPDIGSLMGFTGFATHASTVSYVLAGSFCRFLIDEYGIRRLTLLYGDRGYDEVYGRSRDELIGRWRAFLRTIPVAEQERDVVDVLFRRPTIFRKVCARVVGERNRKARELFTKREYAEASSLFAESYHEGEGSEALTGYLWSALRLGHYQVLTSALDTIIMSDEYPARFLPLFLPIGDAFWAEGKMEQARHLYGRLVLADLSEGLTEAAEVRIHALEDARNWTSFLHYFFFDGSDTARAMLLDTLKAALPESWIPRYLAGRLSLRLGRYAEAVDDLQSLEPGIGGAYIESLQLQSIGRGLFRQQRFEEARTYFWISLNARNTAQEIHTVNDWVDRCEWMERNFPRSN
jgi:hypothetical protein